MTGEFTNEKKKSPWAKFSEQLKYYNKRNITSPRNCYRNCLVTLQKIKKIISSIQKCENE